MAKIVIELKVNHHEGSGRYTLSQKVGTAMPVDQKDGLLGTMDRGDFYRLVAHKIADLAAIPDNTIVFKDISP